MKKLLIGTAVVAAAFGLRASIESANVVGFSEVPVTKFSTHVGTFTSLGATEANMTVGEIKTNSKSDGKGNYVTGWNPDMDRLYFVDQTGKMSTPFYNVPEWQAKETSDWEGYESGWYLEGDEDYVCRNSSQACAFGDGFVVKASSANMGGNPALVLSGQVKKESKDIPVTKFILTGNTSPVAIKLGKVTTNSESDGKGNYVAGWNPDMDRLLFVDETGKLSTPFYNVPKWQAEETADWEGYDSGWYIEGDEDYACQNNNYTVEPGCGFVIKASSATMGKEPAIQIPSAL